MTPILLSLLWVFGAGTFLFPHDARAQALAIQERGGVRWVCAGIGFEEREALSPLRQQANVELVFVTAPRGAYLSDVLLAVHAGESDEHLLSVRTQGPICLLHLPAGRYRIEASRLGEHRSLAVSGGAADGRPPRTILAFPEEP